jgi:hypothetical protein
MVFRGGCEQQLFVFFSLKKELKTWTHAHKYGVMGRVSKWLRAAAFRVFSLKKELKTWTHAHKYGVMGRVSKWLRTAAFRVFPLKKEAFRVFP